MRIKKYKDFKQFAERDPKRPVKYLVIHSFALSIKKMIESCNTFGVSPHYLIDVKGNVSQLVDEDKTAWHAGKSFWGGEESLNAASVGIELQNKTLGQTTYPEVQIKALVTLAKDIMKRHHISPENVVGHSDVAPTRKTDPGKSFPWEKMAKYGIGLWAVDTTGSSRQKVGTLLRTIGYDTTDEKAALFAFLRHFMPERVPEDKEISRLEENLSAHVANMPCADREVKAFLGRVACAYKQARQKTSRRCKKNSKK